MIYLRAAIPLTVFAYIIYKSYRKPIYFTIIPWIVGLGRALFIDLIPTSVVATMFNFQFSPQDLLFGLVVIGWGYSCLRRKSSGHFWAHSGIWVIALWFLFLVVEALVSITDQSIYIGPRGLLDERFWFYIPLSFLLFVDTYRRYDRQEFLEVVGVFSALVAGITVFYILDSGFSLKIYPYEKYYQEFLGSAIITRDFTTLSIFWLGLVLGYLLVMPRSPLMSILLLSIMFIGIFFSYTRALIIGFALIYVLAGILLSAKSLIGIFGKEANASAHIFANKSLHVGRCGGPINAITSRWSVLVSLLFVLPGLALMLFIALPVLLPIQSNFLAGRLLEAGNIGSQGISAIPNMMIRWSYFTSAWRDGMVFDPWLGSGLLLRGNSSDWMSYDSDWIHLVFRLGIVGVVVFMLPLIWAQWKALTTFFIRRDKTAECLALIIFLFNVFAFLQRFVSIVYLWWYPLSTLGIALATVEADQLWHRAKRLFSIRWI